MSEWTPEAQARAHTFSHWISRNGLPNAPKTFPDDFAAALAEIDRLTAKLKGLENVPLHTTQPQQSASEGEDQ